MLYLYQVFFMNGKAISFWADDVAELFNDYVFTRDGETVAQFNKTNIAGYILAGVHNDNERS